MVRGWLATVSLLILLILALTYPSAAEKCDVLHLEEGSQVVSALEEIGGALKGFHNILQESLQHSQGSDANLVKLVEKFSEEISDLKHQLADKDEKVREEVIKVQDLERKLNTSLKEAEEYEEKLKLQNSSVASPLSKITCSEVVSDPGVIEQVMEYAWSKGWNALRTGLEAVLSNSSTAYKQMHHVNDIEHSMWEIGSNGYSHLAALLVCTGMPPDAWDPDRDTMLHGAAYGGQTETAAMLLDLGADVDARGSSGRTPLMFAAAQDRLKTAKLLVERGASLDSLAGDGDTVLHIAARGNHPSMVRYLVEAGATTAALGKDGDTALDVANFKGYTAVVNFLTQYPH